MAPPESRILGLTTARLLRRQNTWVVGLPGSGKTWLIDQLVGWLTARDQPQFRLRGNDTNGHRPFASVLAMTPDLADATSATQLHARAHRWLRDRITAGTVVVIDDVEQVDQASLAALAAVVAELHPAMVVTSTQGRSSQARRAALQLGFTGAQLRIAPMQHDQMHALLESTIGPGVDQQLVSRVLMATGGLPGLAIALAQEAEQDGAVSQALTGWTIEGPLWRPSLSWHIDSLIHDLSQTTITAPNQLALFGPVELELVTKVVAQNALVVLERRGLIEVFNAVDSPVVTLFPPLLGAALRASMPLTLRTRLRAGIEQALGTTVTAGLLRQIEADGPHWTSPGRSTVALAQLVRARRAVEGRQQRRRWELNPSPANALSYVTTLHELSASWPELLECAEGTNYDADTMAGAELAVVESLAEGERADQPARALAELRHSAREHPRLAGFYRGTGALIRISVGGRQPPGQLDDPAPSEHRLSFEAIRAARAAQALVNGRVGEANTLIEGFEPHNPCFTIVRDVVQAMSALLDGCLDESLASAARALEQGRRRLEVGAITAHAYMIALALWTSGRHEDLRRHLGTILALGPAPQLMQPFQRGLLTIAMMDAARRGPTTYSQALEQQRCALTTLPGPLPLMNLDPGSAGVSSAERGRPGAWWSGIGPITRQGTVLQNALSAFWRGIAGCEADQLTPPADLGQHARTLQLLWQAAEQMATDHPDRLLETADQLAAQEFRLHASLARVHGAVMHHRADAAAAAALAAQRAWDGMVGTQLDPIALFAPLIGQIDLSEREWQIGHLVTSGMTNTDVARDLVLSVRTVENHLQNAFRKVGVSSREQLGLAFTTWLSADPSSEPRTGAGGRPPQ